MPYINTDGDRLYFTLSRPDYQAGPSLVCIHGSGGSHTHWPEKLRDLKKYRVVAIDLPGHGKSQGNGRETIESYASGFSGFIRALNMNRVILMGHSLGGAIAQNVALQAPRWLEGLILVGTGARLRVAPSILDILLGAAEPMANLISEWAFGPSASPSLVDAMRLELQQTPVSVTRGDFNACHGFDVMQTIADIRIPVIVISGSEDRLTPPKYGSYLAANIPGARHVTIPNAGHMMALEYPDTFVKQVMAFIDQTLTTSGG